MFDDYLINYCAPALAGIKPANLFVLPCQAAENPQESLNTANQELNGRGVFLEALRSGPHSVLIFLYRKNQLEDLIKNEKAAGILRQSGYPAGSIAGCIEMLKARMPGGGCFPHEIGVLLGYPAEDVRAFIAFEGKNSLYDGCWKVYSDVEKSKKLFAEYRSTTESFRVRHKNGASVKQLTLTS